MGYLLGDFGSVMGLSCLRPKELIYIIISIIMKLIIFDKYNKDIEIYSGILIIFNVKILIINSNTIICKL